VKPAHQNEGLSQNAKKKREKKKRKREGLGDQKKKESEKYKKNEEWNVNPVPAKIRGVISSLGGKGEGGRRVHTSGAFSCRGEAARSRGPRGVGDQSPEKNDMYARDFSRI